MVAWAQDVGEGQVTGVLGCLMRKANGSDAATRGVEALKGCNELPFFARRNIRAKHLESPSACLIIDI